MKHDQEYFAQAASWAVDTQARSSRSRRLAWIVGAVAIAVAALEALALAMLTPLKTVQPITLLVDRQTGFVQALDPQSPRRVVADEALTQSYLAQYVIAREGFDRAIVSLAYRKVALLSTGSARTTYLAAMPASNPASPFQRYPAGTVVSVQIKSVSMLSTGVALVRFDTQEATRGGPAGPAQPFVAVIRYQYSNAPMSLEDRLVNPLGFQVLTYRRDAEAPPVALAVPADNRPLMAPAAAPLTPAVGGPIRPDDPQSSSPPVPAGPSSDYVAPPTVDSHIPSGSPLSNSGG